MIVTRHAKNVNISTGVLLAKERIKRPKIGTAGGKIALPFW